MERNHVTQMILDLTLEILHLLTGESVTSVRLGDLVAINAPSHYFVIPEKTNKRKILAVTNKIMELLTSEEWEYLDGQKDLCKAAMIEDQPMDGSRKRNPPRRCHHPLYSEDATQEDEEVPYRKGDVLNVIKVEEPDEEELYQKSARPCKEEPLHEAESDDIGETSGLHSALPPDYDMEEKNFTWDQLRKNKTADPSNSEEAFPEKSFTPTPSMRLSKKSSQKEETGQLGPHTAGRPSEPSNPEQSIVVNTVGPSNSKESPASTPIILHRSSNQPKESPQKGLCLYLGPQSASRSSDPSNPGGSSVVGTEDHSSSEESSPEKSLAHSPSFHPGPHSSSDPSKESPVSSSKEVKDYSGNNRLYSCCQCGKTFMLQLLFGGRPRTGREPFTCCECQNRNTSRSGRSGQQDDNGEGTTYYACPNCPKTFSRKTYLVHHQRIHREDSNYSCVECGKCFTNKSNLVVHARTHTGERPFPCYMCGKNFTHRSSLVRHLRAHMR